MLGRELVAAADEHDNGDDERVVFQLADRRLSAWRE